MSIETPSPPLPPPPPPPPAFPLPSPPPVVQIFFEGVRVLGRFSPVVIVAALFGYGFIRYTEVESAHIEAVDENVKKGIGELLEQSNTNFQHIIDQSKGGAALYMQLNDLLAAQIENLKRVSDTQKMFLDDSSGYLTKKLKNVDDDIQSAKDLDASKRAVIQLTDANAKLRTQLDGAMGDLQTETTTADTAENAYKDDEKALKSLHEQLVSASNSEAKLRGSAIALGEAVNEKQDATAISEANALLLQYKTDYIPSLFAEIFSDDSPKLFLAERLIGESENDLRDALTQVNATLKNCVFATYEVKTTTANTIVAVSNMESPCGIRDLVEFRLDNGHVVDVTVWSSVALFRMPVDGKWFSSEATLYGVRQQIDLSRLEGDEGKPVVATLDSSFLTGKISVERLLEAIQESRPEVTGDNKVHVEVGAAKSYAVGDPTAYFTLTSGGISRHIVDLGNRGYLLAMARMYLQNNRLDQTINGGGQLAPDAHDTLLKLIQAVARRDPTEVGKLTTIGNIESLVDPLLRMVSVELVSKDPTKIGGPIEMKLTFHRSPMKTDSDSLEDLSADSTEAMSTTLRFERHSPGDAYVLTRMESGS